MRKALGQPGAFFMSETIRDLKPNPDCVILEIMECVMKIIFGCVLLLATAWVAYTTLNRRH